MNGGRAWQALGFIVLAACHNPLHSETQEEKEAHASQSNAARLRETLSCEDCDLTHASLASAKLGGAHLARANLRGADLSGADLHGADLRGAVLDHVIARGADLRATHMDNAWISESDFTEANFEGVDLVARDGRQSLQTCNFTRANLSHALLHFCSFSGSDGIYKSEAKSGVDYYGKTKYKTGGAILLGANFEGADLSNTDMRRADLRAANLGHADASSVQFEDADVDGASFDGAHLALARFRHGERCAQTSIGHCVVERSPSAEQAP